MHKRYLEVINKIDRIRDFYYVGPVQRAAIEWLIEEIVSVVNDEYDSDDFQEFILSEGLYCPDNSDIEPNV